MMMMDLTVARWEIRMTASVGVVVLPTGVDAIELTSYA